MRRYMPLGTAILALTTRLIPGPRTIDDAFITFRYARNLLSGLGFVYNPGQAVLGTTTPLYTLLLALLGQPLGGAAAPFPEIAWVVNSLADALTCLLLWHLGRRLGSSLAGAGAALVWALAPFSVTFAIGGLETSLYVLLLVASAVAYLDSRTTLTALLAALAVLTRPDALILVGPLVLDWAIPRLRERQWGAIGRVGLVFFLPVGAWALFASLRFGSPIPHSVAAKNLAYQLPPEAAFIRLLQHYATPFLGHLTFGTLWIGVGLVLYPALALLGSLRALRESPRAWPFVVYPWLYFATFALANPLIFRWYLTPPLPFYILTILLGADRALADLSRRLLRSRQNAPAGIPSRFGSLLALLVVVVAPGALSLQDWVRHPDHGPDRPAPEMAWIELELEYRQAAEALKPVLDTDSLLAASDVGVLGYFTPARILDTVGLNSPEALAYYPIDPKFYVINLATSPDLILAARPDYVVLLEVYGREGVFKDHRFREQYELVQTIPSTVYTSDGMLIFSRRPTP